MTAITARALGAAAIGLGLVTASALLHAGDVRYPAARPTDRVLYVESGPTARRLALAYRGLAADVYWIRTIQHFGGDMRSGRVVGRFALLKPLLELTTSLDPRFMVAYRIGAMFLALPEPSGAGRVDDAVALLETGLQASPDRWQYAYDIGFVYYLDAGDYRTAGAWFSRAATMPHAPEWIAPLAATTLARGGDRRSARRLFMDLWSADQVYLRQAAARGLAQIDALDAIDRLQRLVDAFDETTHRFPTGWSDLIRAGQLSAVPTDGAGVTFVYDAVGHRVLISPASPLVPLPTALKK